MNSAEFILLCIILLSLNTLFWVVIRKKLEDFKEKMKDVIFVLVKDEVEKRINWKLARILMCPEEEYEKARKIIREVVREEIDVLLKEGLGEEFYEEVKKKLKDFYSKER